MAISQKLLYISENFQKARTEYSKLPPGKRMLDFKVVRTLTVELPEELNTYSKAALRIVGSAGKGNFAEIPHICGFDPEITNSAQDGYYIVYLFSADSARVYLSLNQGWTSFLHTFNIIDAKIEIKKCARIARNLIKLEPGFTSEEIELSSKKGKLAFGYELGNICSKVYNIADLPDDKELLEDWNALSNTYRQLKNVVGRSLVDFAISFDDETFQESIQNVVTNQELPTGPLPMPLQRVRSDNYGWQRRPLVSAIALKNALYLCEYDSRHITFTSKRSGHQFVEAHHLIPLEFQRDFKHSLDVPENVLSLCPNCHRAFHHSRAELKIEMINLFLERRHSAILKRGISIDKFQLLKYYTRTNEGD